MKKFALTSSLLIVCLSFSFGQYKILLAENKAVEALAIEIEDELIIVSTESGKQVVDKTDVLCVIPESGKSFTFRENNNKKMKILKRDIENGYQGTDRARIFAYKYYKSGADIGKLYLLNSDDDLTEEEFKSAYNKQRKQFKKRTIISASLAGFAFVIGATTFISTINEASNYQ